MTLPFPQFSFSVNGLEHAEGSQDESEDEVIGYIEPVQVLNKPRKYLHVLDVVTIV